MACNWLGEIPSCSCLTATPGPAWVRLSKIYKPFPGSLVGFIISLRARWFYHTLPGEITVSFT